MRTLLVLSSLLFSVLSLANEATTSGSYTVQVNSYLSEKDATQHVERLKRHHKDVFYISNVSRGQVWYKVCVGRFPSPEKADVFRKDFVRKAQEAFAIVISLDGSNVFRQAASVPKAKKTSPDDYLYTLQVASYPKRQDAEARVKTLDASKNPRIEEFNKDGKAWFRVFLGLWETKAEAEVHRAEHLSANPSSQAFVKRLEK
jgi:septal ring-binding cell division protein DamX